MVSTSSLAGRPLFLVLALVLVCLSLCVPRVLGDFGFSNWTPPVESVTTETSEGDPVAVEFDGKIFVAWRYGGPIQWVTSTDGVTFTEPATLANNQQTAYDPALVVVKDTATGASTLVMLFAGTPGGFDFTHLSYATYNPTTGTFNTPVDTGVVSNLNGELDAIFTPSSNQLVVVYLTPQCSPNPCTPTSYHYANSLYATLTNGQWTWGGLRGIGGTWRQFEHAAVFNTQSYTYLAQVGSGNGFLWYWSSSSNLFTIVPNGLGGGVAYDQTYSGFTATSFTLPPLLNQQLAAVFYISPSNNALSYSLVADGTSVAQPVVGTPKLIGFNDGETISNPQQPFAVYFSVTKTVYVFYIDPSDSFHVKKISATLSY